MKRWYVILLVMAMCATVGCAARRPAQSAHESAGDLMSRLRLTVGEAVRAVDTAEKHAIFTPEELEAAKSLVVQTALRYNSALSYYESTGDILYGDVDLVMDMANHILRMVLHAEGRVATE